MDLFARAKTVAIGLIKTWLPDGKVEGKEWSAINPTRSDKSKGSFKVELSTGKWYEGATGEGGKDAVSLYAYLHEARLTSIVTKAGYKNIRGGVQAEAAKEILSTYDPTYFPSKADLFVPTESKEKKGSFWDGWYSALIDNAALPKQDVAFFEKKWGKKIKQWDFWKGTKFKFRVCRFKTGETNSNGKQKKEDRPFTVWTDGDKFKWRAVAPEELYPLWNYNKLQEYPNKPVCLSEGQKDAEILDSILSEKWVCSGWYGGAGGIRKTDWSTLMGREVWFLFDADGPGRQSIAALKKIASEFEMKLHLVFPPKNCEKGWSLADQVEVGWSETRINDYLNENTSDSETLQKKFIEDNPFDFKILGYSGENITFYPYGSHKVIKTKASAINKSILLVLQDRKLWGDFFSQDNGGIAWDAAINYILRQAEKKPVFNPAIVRGSGAWWDDGKLVINTGEKLIIEGKIKDLHENYGNLVFERSSFVPYELENKISVRNIKFLINISERLPWRDTVCSDLFIGWLLLAPFGGALQWRPSTWITGAKGSGKSWILQNIVIPLVGSEFGILGFGTSTPAGIRGALNNSGKCIVLEEMESDNQKFAEYIDQNLKAIREGASGRGEGFATLHQSQDGEGKQWRVQSMAMCASIGASIKHGADKSRFSILSLFSPGEKYSISESEKMFESIQEDAKNVTKILGRAIVSRTMSLFDELQAAIRVMTGQLAQMIGNRRQADQIGTLFAGRWMFEHNKAPIAHEAREFLESKNIPYLTSSSAGKSDEERCLDEIMGAKIDVSDGVNRSRVSISIAVMYWSSEKLGINIPYKFPGRDPVVVKNELEQIGLKLVVKNGEVFLRFACDHSGLKKILRDTPWSLIYDEILTRLPKFSDNKKGPNSFAGIPKRFVEARVQDILNFE